MKNLVERGVYSESVTLHVLEKKAPVTILHHIKGTQKCLITGNPIFNDKHEIIRVVTTVRDVTELNKLEQKLEAAEDISKKYHLELQHLRQQQMRQTDLVEHSAAMKKVLALSYKAAQVDSTVLISGNTGVGKEMVAKFIHKNSPPADVGFINVNCAAIPESLLESELSGYEKGAFTGALNSGKPGMFELADQGTIFLDEMGICPTASRQNFCGCFRTRPFSGSGPRSPSNLMSEFWLPAILNWKSSSEKVFPPGPSTN